MLPKNKLLISKALAILAVSHLVTDLSQGALPVLLPFLKNNFNLTYTQVGFIVLTQNLTSSVIQPIFGFISDKISMPWLLPVSLLLSGLGMAATGLTSSYYVLLTCVIIGGLGIAGFHPQASKSAHFISSSGNKGLSMGIFSVGGNLGMAVGSIFMTILLSLPGITDNTVYFFLPAGVMSAILWLKLAQVSPPPLVPAATVTAGQDPRKPMPFMLLGLLLTFIFIRSSIYTGLSTYIPLYYVDYLAGSPAYASYLVSVFLLAGAVGTLTGAALSDYLGRKTVIILSMLVTLPLIGLFKYTSGIVTVVLLALTGLALISSFATTLIMAQEMMPGYVGMASGLTIGFSVGMGGVGVTILGYIADHFSIHSVFTIMAILPLVGIALAAFLPGKLFKRD